MLEYKVCFYITYKWGYRYSQINGKLILPKNYYGKMYYCGATLEEAVAKVRPYVANLEVQGTGFCTSMGIRRGREKGKNIRWSDYHKRGAAKEVWMAILTDAVRRRDTAAEELRRRAGRMY
jgi:hypothetical protein